MISMNGTSTSATSDMGIPQPYAYERNSKYQSNVPTFFGDENGNSLSDMQCLAVNLSSNGTIPSKNSYSRKREATTTLPDDPKRKDNLRSTHNKNSIYGETQSLNTLKQKSMNQYESFTDNGNLSSYSQGASYISSVKNLAPVYNGSRIIDQRQLCERACVGNSSENGGFESVNNLSCDDRSTSSSISDLSVHSTGNSTGIQEHLNGLHLTDETTSIRNDISKPPLCSSLFHRVPPTIYFSSSSEKVVPLPPVVCSQMKWKLSTITPVCIRQIVERAGFQVIKGDTTDWTGTWGKHIKCLSYKSVQDYQKVNHFPGSFHLGRKDKIWSIYSKMLQRHGDEVFSFFPETYVLPQDIRQLRLVWEKEGPQKRWIIKPPASARGTGIKVINRWAQIPKKRAMVVQRYLNEPYLINGAKFDLRWYVLVPSYEPLRIYIFDDGLVRFASASYSTSVLSLNDPYMHLTNYSINKKNAMYTSNDDENTCQGHKWSLKSFWVYMAEKGIDIKKIQEEILDLIIKTIICSEGPMTQLIKKHAKNRYNCFELFGFDIMLDKDLKPWLLEVNISPSLHTSSPLDNKIKCQLTKDMLNIAGFRISEKVLKDISPEIICSNYGITQEEMQNMCMNKSLHQWYLSPEEKSKQSKYIWQESETADVLEELTPDDVRHLIESEDELCRCGFFKRVFPTNTTQKYLKFFERVRYYNILFDAWEQKYHQDRSEGVTMLQELCQKNFHLQTIYREMS